MKRRRKTVVEEGALELIERSVYLLRRAPLSVLILYYVGAIPFVLGLLFFLGDMSSSAFAAERSVPASLGLAGLYVWMRVWQSLFCQRLYRSVSHLPEKRTTATQVFRQIYIHATYSTLGLVVVPVAMVVMVPFGWVSAYYNSLCIVDAEAANASAKAWEAARLWPKQNHLLLSLVSVFAFMVFLNLLAVLGQLPYLLKSLFGIETPFTQSYYWMANTTFLGIVCGLVYLAVDPLVKATYVLRYQAGEAITSGEDLLAELKALPPRRRSVMQMTLIAILFLCSVSAPSNAEEPEAVVSAIPAEALDASVREVMLRPEFTWRMPREAIPDEERELGFFGRFFKSVGEWLEKVMERVGDAVSDFFKWLDKLFGGKQRPAHKPSSGFDVGVIKALALLLGSVLCGVLVVYLIRAIRLRSLPAAQRQMAVPVAVEVDLEDEELVATLLEEDEWIALARELMEKGEFRTALRAWFLAGLAFLSRAELLVVLTSKSNLEYRRELMRRARRYPALMPLFSENIQIFERSWYGLHTATAEETGQLEQNLLKMRGSLDA